MAEGAARPDRQAQYCQPYRAYASTGHFGDHAGVGDGVSELRIHAGPGYRLYYTVRGEEIVLLLCGGDKGSQERDIAKAKEMASELE